MPRGAKTGTTVVRDERSYFRASRGRSAPCPTGLPHPRERDQPCPDIPRNASGARGADHNLHYEAQPATRSLSGRFAGREMVHSPTAIEIGTQYKKPALDVSKHARLNRLARDVVAARAGIRRALAGQSPLTCPPARPARPHHAPDRPPTMPESIARSNRAHTRPNRARRARKRNGTCATPSNAPPNLFRVLAQEGTVEGIRCPAHPQVAQAAVRLPVLLGSSGKSPEHLVRPSLDFRRRIPQLHSAPRTPSSYKPSSLP